MTHLLIIWTGLILCVVVAAAPVALALWMCGCDTNLLGDDDE